MTFREKKGEWVTDLELKLKKQELEETAKKAAALPLFAAAGMARHAAVLGAEIISELAGRELARGKHG